MNMEISEFILAFIESFITKFENPNQDPKRWIRRILFIDKKLTREVLSKFSKFKQENEKCDDKDQKILYAKCREGLECNIKAGIKFYKENKAIGEVEIIIKPI
uniref:Uncharacterized protein n=1 Tax=Acrobeloides nanus TaxID=290746 RepID=A0A914CG30_9BILA